ncbi:hypothetical protein PIIN_07654 [Serendipita indica DSM 11827]|uniref:F-box domain-containing protein n=1 Tax=Serendipita indica (strain DSM 11827) TaxID=1109443 RepID=G4TQV7_SERID|nr:hypothetical protein PIIN_07654 [Serendipita indica DSM 11827]
MAHDDRVPRRINNDVIPFDILGQIMQSMIDDFDSEHDPYILGRLQLPRCINFTAHSTPTVSQVDRVWRYCPLRPDVNAKAPTDSIRYWNVQDGIATYRASSSCSASYIIACGHGLLVFPVGSSFPHLRDLTIADTIPQSKAFRYFSAPKLQVLRVSAQIFRNSSILKCIGIPFANIRHLEVTCDIDYQVESQESDLYALEVLAVVPNLQKLVIRQYDRSCGRCSSICAHAMKMFRGHLDLIVYYLPGREPAGAMDISRAHSIVVG